MNLAEKLVTRPIGALVPYADRSTVASYCEVVVWNGNFHTLKDGQVYGSRLSSLHLDVDQFLRTP